MYIRFFLERKQKITYTVKPHLTLNSRQNFSDRECYMLYVSLYSLSNRDTNIDHYYVLKLYKSVLMPQHII